MGFQGPALPGTGVASAIGPLPEVVVGGVWDLGHGACRCRVAVRGRRGVAAGGSDPLDEGGGREPVAVGAGGPARATCVKDKTAAAATMAATSRRTVPASSSRFKRMKHLMDLPPNIWCEPERFAGVPPALDHRRQPGAL